MMQTDDPRDIKAVMDALLQDEKQLVAIFVENGHREKQLYTDVLIYLYDHILDCNARSSWLELENGTRVEFYCRSVHYHNKWIRREPFDRVIDI